MSSVSYTNSSTSNVLNENTGNFLDMDLEFLNGNIEDITSRVNNFSYFVNLEQIGIEGGSETIEEIAQKLPEYSVLNFHKTSSSGSGAVYPHTSGLLTVIKGYSTNRVKFEFSRVENSWIGFYDAANGDVNWSGWKRVVTDTHTVNTFDISDLELSTTCTLEEVIQNMEDRSHVYFAPSDSSPYKTLINQLPKNSRGGASGVLHIFKDRNTRTVIEFFESDNGFDEPILNARYWCNYDDDSKKLSTWGIEWQGSGESQKRPLRTSAFVGMLYFDTTISKPIWWNGTDWVDANGNPV